MKTRRLVKCTYEWRNNDANNQGHDVCPHWHCDVLFEHNNEAKNEAEDKDDHIPPPGNFLVVLCHVLMVSIIISAGSGALVCTLDVTAPEQNRVSDEGADLRSRLVREG
jgi:hypothetical protein